MSLVKYIIRRLINTIPIMFGVLVITFVLTRMMPGNPFLGQITHGTATEIAIYQDNIRRLGLDQPIHIQFFRYLSSLLVGDWGYSFNIAKGKPVWEIIWQRFPRTVEIAILAVFFSSIIGIWTGIISSTHRNKIQDTVIRLSALMGVAVPVFWLGLMCQYLFAYKLAWLPSVGYKTLELGDPAFITGFRLLDCLLTGNIDLFLDSLKYYILPVFCLSFITIASITRQSRSSMLEVLELDYIRTARAKGCNEKVVTRSHALRNAMIPTITIIGMNFGGLLGGAVLTETTFNLKGMGMLVIEAIRASDYNVINACVFLITFLFIIVNLITDIIYGIVDPRIRY